MSVLVDQHTTGREAATLDEREPRVRLRRLLDPGSIMPLHPADDSGVLAVSGRASGTPLVAYCTDARHKGGSLGAAGAQHVVQAIEHAVLRHCPVVGIWHSGGARLADGVESLDGVGQMFKAMTWASGRVAQLSVVFGPAAGAAAYGPALTDLVIMSEAGRVFVTGPDVVRSVTGEQVDMVALGGPNTHSRRSGVAHIATGTEDAALTVTRQLVDLLANPGEIGLADLPESDLEVLLPASARRAYDVRVVIQAILDKYDAGFIELQPLWAPNVVVGLGRLAGRTVGVVANNPLRKGGCLDSLSAEKAARFVRMCDSLGVPLLVLVDVPGYLPGVDQEWGGVVRRGAKLLHAFAECSVPRVTLITRKAYGGAYIAMNSRALGATAVFAWPKAQIAVMAADAAVDVLHRKRLAALKDPDRGALREALVDEHQRAVGGVERALAAGVVDQVIDPNTTRRAVAEVIGLARAARGYHNNIPL